MEGMILHNCQYALITYEASQSMIQFEWKEKPTPREKFKETLCLYASLVEDKQPKTLFVNAVNQRITVTQDLQEWHDREIIPRYHKAGVEKMAFLIPNHIFSEVTHKKTFESKQAKELMTTQFFKDEAKALGWLQEGLKRDSNANMVSRSA